MVGGARTAYIHDLNNRYNVSDDSRLLEGAVRSFDWYMQRNFAGWEDSNAYTDRGWTGSKCMMITPCIREHAFVFNRTDRVRLSWAVMGYSSDGLPPIGLVPGQSDQYILAGLTGHRMPHIFLAVEGIAKLVVDGVAFEETGLPRLFQVEPVET